LPRAPACETDLARSLVFFASPPCSSPPLAPRSSLEETPLERELALLLSEPRDLDLLLLLRLLDRLWDLLRDIFGSPSSPPPRRDCSTDAPTLPPEPPAVSRRRDPDRFGVGEPRRERLREEDRPSPLRLLFLLRPLLRLWLRLRLLLRLRLRLRPWLELLDLPGDRPSSRLPPGGEGGEGGMSPPPGERELPRLPLRCPPGRLLRTVARPLVRVLRGQGRSRPPPSRNSFGG